MVAETISITGTDVNSITVTDTSGITVTTVGTQGLAGPSTILGRSVTPDVTAGANDDGSLLVYDHSNTRWNTTYNFGAGTVVIPTLSGTNITAATAFLPDASDGASLGTAALEFSDLFLADGAVINFGDDQDVSLTHVADTGLLLSSTDRLQFGDSGTYIHQSADGVLDLVSDTEIELTATTIDINGNVDVSGTLTVGGALDFSEANITNVGSLALDSISGDADSDTSITFSGSNVITIAAAGSNQVTFIDGAIVPSTDNDIDLGTSSVEFKNAYFDGTVTSDAFAGPLTGAVTGNADTATTLATARTIGGVSFDGSANIAVTLAATATALANARTIGGTSFDGTANIAVALSATATALASARTIGGTSFDGTANIVPATITVADTTDTSSYVALFESATGSLAPKTDAAITYNAGTGALTSTSFVGNLTGNVTGNTSGSSGSTTGNAATATALETARTIGGTSFDGTANIVPGTATVATTVTITDNESTDESNALIFTSGGDVDGGDIGLESDGTLTYNPSTGKVTATGFIGTLTGDVTGNTSGSSGSCTGLSATSTALATARTIGGTSFDGTSNIAVALSATSTALATARNIGGTSFDGTASIVPATITVADTTDSSCYISMFEAATGDQGPKTDAGVTYNASTGALTSTSFVGPLTGNVTGNASGTAATVTTAAQTNITSLGTLTALTVDDVAINGKVITMTGSSGDTAVLTAGTNGTLAITTTDAAASAANIQITADGTAELAGTTVTLDSGGGITLDADSGTITFADGGASLGTITSSGYTGNVVGNVTGNTSGSSGSTTGNAATATALATGRTIGMTGDVVWTSASFDGSGNVTGSATIQANSVALSTDTTGNYVATVAGTSNEVTVSGSGSEGAGVTIGLPDDVTIAGNLTVNGDSVTVNTATLSVEDPLIILAKSNNAADSVDIGFYGLYDTSGSLDLYAGLFRDANDSGKFKLFKDLQAEPTTTVNTSGTGYAVGTLVANIEGNVTGNTSGSSGSSTGNAATATALATARTIGGTSFDGTANIVPATITVADTTDTSSYVGLFESAAGDLGPKTDAAITYNAGTGALTAVSFVGALTGNASGTAATVTTAAQSNITSLGTLTTLTVDNVIINGTTIGHTSDTDLITVASGLVTVAGEVSMTTLDIGGTNVTSTAAEINLLDGITAGTVAASKAVIVDSNKDASGFRNVTLTGELDAATLDVSGNVDIDGTTNLDAVDIDDAVQIDGTVSVGVNDTGYDVKFFGATASKSMLWDESADSLIVTGTTTMTGNATVSGTLGVTGETTLSTHLNMGDSDIIKLGASADLQLYHDGSNSYITNNTGILNVTNNDFRLKTSGAETMLRAVADGAVELMHNNYTKLTTVAGGINITGDTDTDTLTVSGNGTVAGTLGVTGALTGTLGTAAQSNITSLGTLTTLTVDNVNINGNTISSTNSNGNLIITPNGTGNVNVNTDVLAIQGTEGETAALALQADESDDNGDEWRFLAGTDQTLGILNNISGSSVAQITLTPHATVASSTTAIVGGATVGGTLGVTGATTLGNNLPIWSGSYGGALFLKGNNATSARHAELTIVDSNGDTIGTGLVVDTNRNVGIGTTGPSAKLHVEGSATSGNYAAYIHNASGGGNVLKLYNHDWDVTDYLLYATNGGTAGNGYSFVVDGNGRVGIGDTTPTELLEIASSSDPTLLIRHNTADQASSGKISFREAAGGSTGVDLRYDGSANNFIIDTSDVSNALVIQRTTGNATFAGTLGVTGVTTLSANLLMGNTVTNVASGFSDQTGIGLKYSATVPQIQVSSDAEAMQLGRTSTGGAGQILALRAAGTVKHDFQTTGYNLTGTLAVTGVTTLTSASSYPLTVKSSDADAADIFRVIADDDGAVMTVSKDASDNAEMYLYSGAGAANVQISGATTSYFNGGNVGIGETSPLGKLHVKGADSSGSAHASADELIVENSVDAGLTILSGQSYTGSVYFGDAGDNDAGFISYYQGDNSLKFGTAGTETMRIDSAGTQTLTFANGSNVGYIKVKEAGGGDIRFGKAAASGNPEYDGLLGTFTNNNFRFYTNSTERMRINSAGNVGIGTTAAPDGSAAGFWFSSDQFYTSTTATTANTQVRFYNGNGLVGNITTSGSATAFNTSSDYRLKENVDYSWDATTRLKQLKPARFNWIADETNTLLDGFIAHEVSSVVPEAISGEKDGTETYTDEDGNEQTRTMYQSIDQSKLVPLLVKTIQELEARITVLEGS